MQSLAHYFHPVQSSATNILTTTTNAISPITRQYTKFFEADPGQYGDVQDLFDIRKILLQLDAKYPEHNFLQYEENLKKLDIFHLQTASIYKTHTYESKRVGMTPEAAKLFEQCVGMEFNKALLANERRKIKEMRKPGDSKDTENVPIHFY
jgi:hypothetical protein